MFSPHSRITLRRLAAQLLPGFLFATTAAMASEQAAPPPAVVEPPVEKPVAPPDNLQTFHNPERLTAESEAETSTRAGENTVTELFEGAENGSAQVTLIDPSGSATLIQSTIVFEGDSSFHLTNPDFSDTAVELNPGILVGNDAKLFFATKYGLLTSSQVAKVQVSIDGGSSFGANLWSRAGTGSQSGGFEAVEIDLSAYEGQTIHLRFVLDFVSGSAYPQITTSVGWFFDAISVGSSAALPYYSIGEPTAHEQYNLELINRSRADALAEADRLIALGFGGGDPDIISAVSFFGIAPSDVRSQYEWAIDNGYIAASAQPLAFNAQLIEAARLHTQDMLENDFQDHVTSQNPPAEANYAAGATVANRVSASGYSYSWLVESVYAYADSVIDAHAGFLIDWGKRNDTWRTGYNPDFDDQGMQNPPGHRFSNHNPNYKEIGIGITEGSNGSVGPWLVTQDFAAPSAGGQFITGVVIADMDNDDFYDVGEGLAGVLVTAEPADGTTPRPAYRALTSLSGGYALPVPGDGRYTLSFSHPKYGEVATTCSLSNGENFKVDWIPALLYTGEFGEAPGAAGTMELEFFHAGIDGTPKLETTSDLRHGFTEESSATLSPRDASGNRSFYYDKPDTPSHFSRVVIE